MASQALITPRIDTQWRIKFGMFKAARAAYEAEIARDTNSDACEQAGEAYIAARGELLVAPAPDGSALCEKLDLLLASDDDEYLPAWNRNLVRPVVADYQRLLGRNVGIAQQGPAPVERNREITSLAQGIQEQASRTVHLLDAIYEAVMGYQDIEGDSELAKSLRSDMFDRILVFAQMAKEAAQLSLEHGEKVEFHECWASI